MSNHVVTAPLVITKKDDGSDLYLYEGAFVPKNVSAAEVKRLADRGFIKESDVPGAEPTDDDDGTDATTPAAKPRSTRKPGTPTSESN